MHDNINANPEPNNPVKRNALILLADIKNVKNKLKIRTKKMEVNNIK